MMDEARKLKRGLKDISPLFSGMPAPSPAVCPAPEPLETFAVFHPAAPSDSLLWISRFVASVSPLEKESVVMSIRSQSSTPSVKHEFFAPGLQRFHLSWSEWSELKSLKVSESGVPPSGRLLFFDIDYADSEEVIQIMPFTDKSILFLQPSYDSLVESYRLIKTCGLVRSRMQLFVAYEGFQNDRRGEWLFEHFSKWVSSQFSLSLTWLGNVNLAADGFRNFSFPLASPQSLESKISPEKLILEKFISGYGDAS